MGTFLPLRSFSRIVVTTVSKPSAASPVEIPVCSAILCANCFFFIVDTGTILTLLPSTAGYDIGVRTNQMKGLWSEKLLVIGSLGMRYDEIIKTKRPSIPLRIPSRLSLLLNVQLVGEDHGIDDMNYAVGAHDVGLHDLGIVYHQRAHSSLQHEGIAVYSFGCV